MSIRRRPSAATLAAIVMTLAIGSQASIAATSSDNRAPRAVRSVSVIAADSSSVTVAWRPAWDNVGVTGYSVYLDGAERATTTPETAMKINDLLGYRLRDLRCGTGYTVGVDAYDAAGNHSPQVSTTVSTAACPDTKPPSAPTGIRQAAATETSVLLAWTPSTDDVGVVEYGLYASGLRVATVGDPSAALTSLTCGKTYLIGIDAADAAGNRSARVDSYYTTSACPTTDKPPSTPSAVKVTKTTQTTVALSWTASTDDVGVTGYGLYLSGSRTNETTATTWEFTGFKCGTTYTLGVDARDSGGKRSAVATLSTATSPCTPTPAPSGVLTQTIAGGATLSGVVNWRAVYDANGDKVEDDPGSVEFLVDGSVVLTEVNPPFGDTDGFWASTSVSNGSHSFKVQALDTAGKTIASNTVTATVSNQTTPPPPPAPSGVLTQTIAGGATLSGVVNWRAVYDANGDKVEDDPGSVEFLVDGSVVLTEVNPPFGDTDGFWASTSVSNGSHSFKVQALDTAGKTIASNTVTATVSNQTTPPPPPAPSGVLTQTIAGGATLSGVVNWRAVYDANGDKVEDDPGSVEFLVDGSVVLTEVNPPFGDTDGFWASTSVSNGSHSFKVQALDTAGKTIASNTVTATVSNQTTPSGTGDGTPPSKPGNLKVLSTTVQDATLGWSASTDNVGVAGYGLYYGTTRTGTTPQTSSTFGGLSCGNAYQVGVDAYDARGNRSPRVDAVITSSPCADSQAPTVPGNVTVSTRTPTSITLTWAPSTDSVGVVGYRLYRGGAQVGTTAGTTGIVTGLSCGTNYTLGVDAYDAAGNGSQQAALMVATTACGDTQAPTAPSNLKAGSITATGAALTWAASSDNVGVAGYRIFLGSTRVGQVTSPSFNATGLTCATAYSGGVEAYDAVGNTSPRATVSFATSACAQSTAGNVSISLTGDDTSCVRGNPSKPCKSFRRGYQIAQPGDVIEVAAGSYPDQILESDPNKTSEQDVVFRPAAGATVTTGDVQFGVRSGALPASHVTIDGQGRWTSGEIDTFLPSESNPASDITITNLKLARDKGVYIRGADRLTLRNVQIGPTCCSEDGMQVSNTDGFKTYRDVTNLTLDGVYMHDIVRFCAHDPAPLSSCQDDSGAHTDCIQWWSGVNVTIRNSRFYNCSTSTWLIQGEYGGNVSNWTVEDNMLGGTLDGSSNFFYLTGDSRDYASGQWVLRNNSIDGSIKIDPSGMASGTTIRIANNIFDGACPPAATFANNLVRSKCGSTDVVGSPSYASTNPLSTDLHLRAGSAGIDAGSAGDATPYDIDGQARDARPDVGADEVR